MDSLIGRMLGPYQIVGEIGHGGMAIVYKAYQSKLDRYAAIKVLPPQFTFDPEFVKRFELEAKAAAKLKHPNIVTIFDVGKQDGFHYIAMEFVEGVSLGDLIRREGSLPPARAATIIAQIASALDYAHALGYIHRDVKPSNIMIGAGDHATLTDFGIVKKAAEGTRVTKSGMMMGTPEYMAPEQIRGQTVDARADVYALGIVCYEMLAGRVPFQGDTARVLYGQVNEQPPSMRALNPRVPLAVEQALGGALAKDPSQRYYRAGEFANALSAAAGATDPAAVPTSPRAPEAPTRYAAKPPRKLSSVMLPVLAGIGGAMVLLIMVLAIAINASKPSAPAVALAPTGTPTAVVTVGPTAAATPVPTFAVTPRVTATPLPGTERLTLGNVPMVYVPAGEFLMGSSTADRNALADEEPQHSVYLNAFWMDKYEVTNAQYGRCLAAGKCAPLPVSRSNTRDSYFGNRQYDNYPVVAVSWNDAKLFCEWANKRLPTEAEWEKSARGIDGRLYPWGNTFDKNKANIWRGDGGDTTAVGTYPTGASPYGVMDLAGNVWEWVADWYDPNYYASSPKDNPKGPSSGERRVARGDSWHDLGDRDIFSKGVSYHWIRGSAATRRSAYRYVLFPDTRYLFLGFRCAASSVP